MRTIKKIYAFADRKNDSIFLAYFSL